MEIKQTLAAAGPQDGMLDGGAMFEMGPEEMEQLQEELQSALAGIGNSAQQIFNPDVQAILSQVFSGFGGKTAAREPVVAPGERQEGDDMDADEESEIP